MGVVSVNLRRQESGLALNDGNPELTATRLYIVEVDNEGDDSETARLACPGVGSLFNGMSGAVCIDSRAVMVSDHPSFYEVTLTFSNKRAGGSQSGQPNPLNRSPRFNYGGSNVGEKFFRDCSPQPNNWTGYGPDGTGPVTPGETPRAWVGKPLVNSAGDQFADLPERFRSQGSITITRNEASFNDATAETWRNTINSDAVTLNGVTYPAGTLLMGNITAEGPTTETFTNQAGQPQSVTYWAVSYEIHKKADGWRLNLEDRGLNELNDDDELVPILDGAGVPVAQPWPLDGDGVGRSNSLDQPATLTFQPYTEREWAGHSFV